mgnify:CR=1 FL=1
MWLKTKLLLNVGFAGAVALAPSPLGAAVAVGQPFPPIAGHDVVGVLPATTGSVAVVDFWASWCAPCKASFPAFDQLQAEFAAQRVVIVAVSVDKSEAAYRKFIERLKPSFVTGWDAEQRLVAEVAVPTMPTSYVLDRKGIVRFVHRGFQGERTLTELRAQIAQLLEESL